MQTTPWGTIAAQVQAALQSAITYAKITIIGGAEEYIANQVSQAQVDSVAILIAPPRGSSYMPSNQPKLSGVFRRKYEFQILVVAKTDPNFVGRLVGVNTKVGIDQILTDVYRALEHNNFGGLMENKAGTNFEVGWSKEPLEDKAITIFSTIYTAIKIER